jgi:hypothetical protein
VPPRYAFWTILIDQKPTAFRAREQSELLPTLAQLRRTNTDVVLKWFARGRLWESPEQEREAQRKPKPIEPRTRDWRPGGAHKDPRARFQERRGGKPSSGRSDKPADSARRKPFDSAHGKPLDSARRKPFGAARKPFGSSPGRRFGSAHGKPPKRGPRR